MEQKLESILGCWAKNTIDLNNGGFYGKIDNLNKIEKMHQKSSVLKFYGSFQQLIILLLNCSAKAQNIKPSTGKKKQLMTLF